TRFGVFPPVPNRPLTKNNGTREWQSCFTVIRKSAGTGALGGFMARPRRVRFSTGSLAFSTGVSALLFCGFLAGQEDGRFPRHHTDQLPVEHPECTFFGAQRERFVTDALERAGSRGKSRALSTLTDQVVRAMAVIPGGT